MGKGDKKKRKARAEPQKRSSTAICSIEGFEALCCEGYTRLSDNPEIKSAVSKIADLISSMTIHLMSNTEKGDVRVKNALSKMVDIYPNQYMTRKTFMSALVRILLLEGDGNAFVIPEYEGGLIKNLWLEPPGQAGMIPEGLRYHILIGGASIEPGEILHFVINPDPNYPWKGTGYRTTLKDVADNLKQAAKTKKGFMESKWMPSVIVKVDSQIEEFASKEGRKKLLEQYIESSEAGEPWLIPAEQFDVKPITPLSLNDIAISDSVKMDKRTIASILDVPPFVVGEGTFDADEWNNFISTRIRTLCNAIEQEMTKKLLISPDWYFRFNIRSLYSYDIEKLANVGCNLYTRGIMTGNEVRDWTGQSPMDNLDELVVLENYIPRGMIGDQKKLEGGGE